ncbi:peptidoglycan DD-metalloendopeptidase family protein [Gorillibacterium timonense]|uniref:peptidoglycan DD-metalloendopeptidase family protein n=1 Tax=Gorillibacterium timonense TaxID=1689269 RepID=UPI00071DC9BB|nr:peptidoglycan DD-metalloendopeptidase family protein [Gorillibacterium timonense]
MTAFKSIDWFRRLLSREERERKSQCQSLTATAQGNNDRASEPKAEIHNVRAAKRADSPATQIPTESNMKQPKAAKSQASSGKSKTTAAKSSKPEVASGKKGKNSATGKAGTGKAAANGKTGSKGQRKNSGPMLAPGVKPAAGGSKPGRVAEAAASSAKLVAPVKLTPKAVEEEQVLLEESVEGSAVLAEEVLPAIEPAAEPLTVAEHVEPTARPKLMTLPLQPALKRTRRRRMISAGLVASTLLLVGAITIGGNHYVKVNTFEVYHVYMNDKEVGIVSDPQVVDDFKLAEYRKLADKYPDTQMVLNTEGITVKAEKAFKPVSDDAGTLLKLSPLMSSHAVGVELLVDGKRVGVLKNEEEAEHILEVIKDDYIPEKEKAQAKVAMLSAPVKTATPGNNVLEKVEFVEKVEMKTIDTQPGSFSDATTLVKTLQTGDVRPRTYKVVSGDTLSFIAQKFDITTKDIQKKNPEIKEDFIREGQELNLTVLQPSVTVRTVEKVVETEEIAYGTEVIRDPDLKEGIVKKISPGKEGKKKVTFSLTKENGEVVKEELLQEEVLVKPVNEVIKRGTKVIRGEGTGNFAWPVIGASLSSGFGYRWGKLHKGVDLTSSNRNILASDNGVVESSGYRYDYGNYVLLNHKNGYKTMYGHLSKINVSQGQIVEKGEKIGYMGSTGDSTGVHLHFEVIKSGTVQNPLRYLNW